MIVSLKKSTSDANEKATELAEVDLIVTEPSKEEVKAQKVDKEKMKGRSLLTKLLKWITLM